MSGRPSGRPLAESGHEVVVGVDGGGSKTEVVVADVSGTALGVGRAGPSNWESIGRDAAVAAIGAAVDAALADASRTRGDVVAATYGLAGVDWPSDEPVMRAALGRLGLAGPALVVNDAHIALRAGAPQGWGIVSNVGTGTVTAGCTADGRWFRSMAVGWGEPSGASSLVRDALHAVAAAHHGAGPATALTGAILEHVAGRAAGHAAGHAAITTVPELFEAVSRHRFRLGPDVARVVDAVVEQGDAVAIELVAQSGARHGAMVGGVALRLGLLDTAFDVVCCGSRHVHASPTFAEAFVAEVHRRCPRASITRFDGRAADGAVQLALVALAARESPNVDS